MDVGIVVEQALSRVPGGTGRFALELAAALARTQESGDRVTSWTAWHRDLSLAAVAGVRGPRRLAAPSRGLAVLWERGVGPAPRRGDVVHAPTLLLPPRRGRPLVVTVHDTVPWTHPGTLTPRGVRWHRAMARRAVRTADALTVPTQAVADELREVLPAAARLPVRVLGAGVSGALRCGDPAVADGLDLPSRYLLSLATLEPRKGLDVLLAALAGLGDAAPALVVVGQPGWGGVDVAGQARRLGLREEAVRVLGRLDDAVLAGVLRRADALVVPSRAEGFGLPVIEAMAAGTAVIVSDAPALVEVAGGAARVTPRDDPVALGEAIMALGDEATRSALVAAGRVRAADFDWDEVGRRAWELYRELAQPGMRAG